MRIFRVLGTPSYEEMGFQYDYFGPMFQRGRTMEEIFPGLDMDPLAFDLLMKMFIYDPTKRITAAQALNHPYF